MSLGLKKEIITLLEKEFGKWLDKNETLIISKIPERSKIFPILSGSIVEGFISKGSDLDFSVIVDDRIERPIIRGKLSEEFRRFLDELNEKVKRYGLDHICTMARKIRTTKYLLEFEECRNPQFRVNYFLFGKLIHPRTMKSEIRKRLGTPDEFLEFKKTFQKEYREKYGYKLFNVEKSVLTNCERYGPKRIYREIQLIVNTFLMAYGLEEEKLTEKMDEELCKKILEIMKSTLMREAQSIIEQDISEALRKLFELKKRWKEDPAFKRRKLKFLVKSGMINNVEWMKLQMFLKYLLEYVYEPLQKFYEVQVKLTDALRDNFDVDIQWLGLRRDHAYISLYNHAKVKCLDIIPTPENEFDIYAIVNRKAMRDLIDKNYDKLMEIKVIDSSLGVPLPFKKHIRCKGKGKRIHFKLFSVKRDEDIDSMKKKISKTGLF